MPEVGYASNPGAAPGFVSAPSPIVCIMLPKWLSEFPTCNVELQFHGNIPYEIEGVARAEWLRQFGSIHVAVLEGRSTTDISAVVDCVEACGGKLIHHATKEGPDIPLRDQAWLFSLDHALVRITPGPTEVETIISSSNADEVSRLADALRPAFDRTPASQIHVLRSNNKGGWACVSVGRLTESLCRDNYPSVILDDFDHVVSELSNPQPCGRLILLDGPPGTGKTRLVRGMAAAAQGSAFLMVPASMAAQLGRPDLIDVLLALRASRRPGMPIVIVVEDADSCLVPRQADNANVMAELLNATDGILGDALNLRVIATTNAKHAEIDPALLRPGRLCRRIAVGLLRPDHASRIFERLTGSSRVFDKQIPLAEVYAAARTQLESPAGRLRVA